LQGTVGIENFYQIAAFEANILLKIQIYGV